MSARKWVSTIGLNIYQIIVNTVWHIIFVFSRILNIKTLFHLSIRVDDGRCHHQYSVTSQECQEWILIIYFLKFGHRSFILKYNFINSKNVSVSSDHHHQFTIKLYFKMKLLCLNFIIKLLAQTNIYYHIFKFTQKLILRKYDWFEMKLWSKRDWSEFEQSSKTI